MVNLAAKLPKVTTKMEEYLRSYKSIVVYPSNVVNDPRGNPKLWGNVWVNWDDLNPSKLPPSNYWSRSSPGAANVINNEGSLSYSINY